jgi:phage shock protein E
MQSLSRILGVLSLVALSASAASAQNAPQSATAPILTAVNASAALKLIQQPNVVVLDVRTPSEYATGHVRGAQNLDFRASDFAQQISQLDTAKTYVLYCASGNRSGQASKLMQAKDFSKVVNAGAFMTLKDGGLKTAN